MKSHHSGDTALLERSSLVMRQKIRHIVVTSEVGVLGNRSVLITSRIECLVLHLLLQDLGPVLRLIFMKVRKIIPIPFRLFPMMNQTAVD